MTGKASHKEKSLLRNLLKFLGVLLVSILLLTGLGWYILQDNNPIVLRFLRQMAQDKWNANLRLDGYHLEWENGLADLKVEVEGLRLSNYKKIEDPFLKITKAETFIHPWSFITNNSGIEKIEPIKADSIWIYLLKDSSDVSNFRFNNRSRKSNKKHSASASIFSRLPSLEATFLDFYFDNQFKNKWQRAQLSPMQFVTAQDVEKEWYATFKGDTHFDALVFNEKDGGFLEDVSGLLELELKHFWQQDSLRLTDGFLEVAENKYLLKGDFVRAAPDHIQLEISQPTAILSEVLPLLSNTIKTNLKNVAVDQPIAAVFTMDKLMQVGQRAVVRLDFETRGAKLKFEQLKMSAADLSGFYSNDCDKDGEGSPEEACLVIDKLNGEFMGIIPAELIGKITELKDPKLQATGSLDMSLPRLNELLSSSQKATFQDGEATLNFFYSGRFEDIIKTPFDESKVNMNGVAQFNNVVLDVKNRDELFPALTGQLTFDDKWTTLQDLSLDWLGTELNVTGYMNNLPEFLLYGNEAMETDLNIHLNHLRADKLIPKGSNQTKVKSKVGANWEYEKWKKNLTSLATNINGVIHLKIDTLSYDTLFFTEVATQTRLYTPRQAAYQDSSMIRIDELSAKFMGAAPLFVNFIFPQDTVQEVIFDIEIPSVPLYVNELLAKEARIVNGAMDLQLRASTPLQAMLDPKQFLTELRYDGVINMDEVDADLSRATWPVKKLSGTFDFDSDELYFDDITFDYERSPFSLNGTVTDYAFFRKGMEQKAIVDLQIKGSHLNRRNDELEAAANAVANNQEVTNPSPIKLFHSLDTIYHYATGKIEVQLDSVLTLKHVIQPLIVDVELLDDDDFSNQYQLKVNRFNMGLGENNFVKGTAHIRNSDAPFLNADIEANMSLKKLGELLPSAYMELRDGDFNMDLTYAAPLRDTMNAENYFFNANIDGYAEMNQGYLFYNYRDFKIENINGKFRFDNRALYIDNIDLNLNDNQLIAKGESKDFFPFFLKPNRRANIVMNVNSPSFDFGNFTAPHGLGKDSIDLQESIVRAEPDTTINVFVKTGSYIDLLLAKGSIDMTTTVNELRYNKFLAEDFFGNISIHPDSVQLKKVNMEIANGVCSMNGSITNIVLHEPKMQLSADMEGHDLKELFHQLGFYDQMPLSSENVEGLGFASLTINADVNSNYAILPETMQGDVVVKLSGGELMDVDAFDRVPRFLAKKRNLDHILMDTILVNGQIIGSNLYIDEFDVHSSAFGFSVTGVYNFANAAETKILYAVPFSNLYKRYFTLAQLNGDKVKRKGMKLNLERHNKKGKKKTRWRLRGKGSYKEVD